LLPLLPQQAQDLMMRLQQQQTRKMLLLSLLRLRQSAKQRLRPRLRPQPQPQLPPARSMIEWQRWRQSRRRLLAAAAIPLPLARSAQQVKRRQLPGWLNPPLRRWRRLLPLLRQRLLASILMCRS
jgi:hypothetical protein